MRADEVDGPAARVIGDDLVELSVDGPASAQRLATHLRTEDEWIEVVPASDCVVVRFDPRIFDAEQVVARVQAVAAHSPESSPGLSPLIEIGVNYGGDAGLDLDHVCHDLGLSQQAFVEMHTAVEYTVEMLGFTPGFAYLGGLDTRLNVPRLAEPRQFVPAGSVGIAGGRTGIYALPGPGGWPLVGRISDVLFDPAAADPFRLQPGMRVRLKVPDVDDR